MFVNTGSVSMSVLFPLPMRLVLSEMWVQELNKVGQFACLKLTLSAVLGSFFVRFRTLSWMRRARAKT